MPFSTEILPKRFICSLLLVMNVFLIRFDVFVRLYMDCFRPLEHGSQIQLYYLSILMIMSCSFAIPLIMTGDDVQGISDLKPFLSRQFEMKDVARQDSFIGIVTSSHNFGYYLYKAKYATNLISHSGLTHTKTNLIALYIGSTLVVTCESVHVCSSYYSLCCSCASHHLLCRGHFVS
ncbi:hypothetical protein Pfo_026685 [Paulownia fortunei]|nr:hypothetical protein Pfo_026685 [Paulownia fortunei]